MFAKGTYLKALEICIKENFLPLVKVLTSFINKQWTLELLHTLNFYRASRHSRNFEMLYFLTNKYSQFFTGKRFKKRFLIYADLRFYMTEKVAATKIYFWIIKKIYKKTAVKLIRATYENI